MYGDFCPRRPVAALSPPKHPTPNKPPTPNTQRPIINVGISTDLLYESCRTRCGDQNNVWWLLTRTPRRRVIAAQTPNAQGSNAQHPTPNKPPTPNTQRPIINVGISTDLLYESCRTRCGDQNNVWWLLTRTPRRRVIAAQTPNAQGSNAQHPTPNKHPTPNTQRPIINVGISTDLLYESCRTRCGDQNNVWWLLTRTPRRRVIAAPTPNAQGSNAQHPTPKA